MKRIVEIILLGLAATTLAFAQAPAKEGKSDAATDVKAVTQLENDWSTAIVQKDTAFIDRTEAPEFLFSGPDGSLSSKADGIAELTSGAYQCASAKIDDLKVLVFGHTAVAFGLETEKSTYKGKDTSGQYRFTDTFVKRKGVWVAVASHSTKVEKH